MSRACFQFDERVVSADNRSSIAIRPGAGRFFLLGRANASDLFVRKVMEQFSIRGKKNRETRDHLRTERHILKKEDEKRVKRMDLKEKAEQTKRETAELKASRENAERASAELKDKLEKLQNQYIEKGIGAYLEKKSNGVQDRHAQNGARQEKRTG
jgi:hypothetical protein